MTKLKVQTLLIIYSFEIRLAFELWFLTFTLLLYVIPDGIDGSTR